MTLPPDIAKLVRFGVVGLATAALYSAVLACGRSLAGLSLPVSGALAYSLALPFNYLVHRRWTFRSDRAHADALPRFAVNFVVGLAINAAFLASARHAGPTQVAAVQLAAMPCLSVTSYLLMATWVFVAGRPSPASVA